MSKSSIDKKFKLVTLIPVISFAAFIVLFGFLPSNSSANNPLNEPIFLVHLTILLVGSIGLLFRYKNITVTEWIFGVINGLIFIGFSIAICIRFYKYLLG